MNGEMVVRSTGLSTSDLMEMQGHAMKTAQNGDKTPFEKAHDDYNVLRDENIRLIDEVRALQADRDALERSLSHSETERDRVTTKYLDVSRRLGSIKANLRGGVDMLIKAIKESDEAISDAPEEVKKYAPSGIGEKIQTENG